MAIGLAGEVKRGGAAQRASACGAAGRSLIAWLLAQESPDEAAEFPGDGNLGLVAIEPARQQATAAQIESVLGFPTEVAHGLRLVLLASG